MTFLRTSARKVAPMIAAILALVAISGCTFTAGLELELRVDQPTMPLPSQPSVQP